MSIFKVKRLNDAGVQKRDFESLTVAQVIKKLPLFMDL
jgi:hypothetical protein